MKVGWCERERERKEEEAKGKSTRRDINKGGPCHKVGERKQRLTPP